MNSKGWDAKKPAIRALALIAVVLTVMASFLIFAGGVKAGLAQVRGLNAKLGSDNASVILTWDPVANATQYRVYRGLNATNLSVLALVNTTTYTDTTVKAGTTYYYAVQAINDTAAGNMSEVVNITIPGGTSGAAGTTTEGLKIVIYTPFLWLGVFLIVMGILFIAYGHTSRRRRHWEGFGALAFLFGVLVALASVVLPYFHLL